MPKVLPKSFYTRHDVVQISKDLLGKILVTNIEGKQTSGIIVETEAYRAPDDKACHAYGDKFTTRTKTMFEEGGVAYVYICYGIHHLFNVVTADKGLAHAVLIRAVQPTTGLVVMENRRNMSSKQKEICNGPGKFTRAMGIFKSHNGISLLSRKSPIYIEDEDRIPEVNILSGPRVGMSTAEECSNWPWRFWIKNNRYTSKPGQVWYDL